MKLAELAQRLGAFAQGPLNLAVDRVEVDSRKVGAGSLFAAVRGARWDGHQFIGQAAAQGAVAVLSESPPPAETKLAWLQVPDIRLAMAMAAAELADHPSRKLRLVGVTGTNGKTTTAYLLNSVFEATGEKSAMIGTVSYEIAGSVVNAERTTPEAPELQRILQKSVTAGCRNAVMEVSSHAIDLKRVHGCAFESAVFTNLTRDHLDYHGTMDAYFAVKRRLFEGISGAPPRSAVLNYDDAYGRQLLALSPSTSVTYGLTTNSQVHPTDLDFLRNGLRFTAHTPAGQVRVMSELIGRPNAYNLLACVATSVVLGLDRSVIETGILACRAVPGRLEAIREGQDFTVIVDYAHTDNALRNVLETARQLGPRRIITVFGCGGDRDPGKRPLMGRIAAEHSDLVILTSDNPRSEDPDTILAQIESGIPEGFSARTRVPDRREAIGLAIAEARTGDLILLAGKGHETCQVLRDRTIPFDDREVAREYLRKRLGRDDGSGLHAVMSMAV
ncbi:MAG: UDP-N-acetylmuramoyl-L-alanyl-D-glutamate--2,6-diaminopimelate ligase [Acidobacteria bacterium]|nr:UDP-N-acetylmuramoyl-L-alanyl-D-glutamate--2,6-diaminopimelate ligase [Acidobacteriota bacterium]